jgi:hypothetical protein
MEEKFFFWYHFRTTPEISMTIPVFERKWYINRFIQQKDRENEMIKKAHR